VEAADELCSFLNATPRGCGTHNFSFRRRHLALLGAAAEAGVMRIVTGE
jgi:hypothetical protein